jgi:hypothetical protein
VSHFCAPFQDHVVCRLTKAFESSGRTAGPSCCEVVSATDSVRGGGNINARRRYNLRDARDPALVHAHDQLFARVPQPWFGYPNKSPDWRDEDDGRRCNAAIRLPKDARSVFDELIA